MSGKWQSFAGHTPWVYPYNPTPLCEPSVFLARTVEYQDKGKGDLCSVVYSKFNQNSSHLNRTVQDTDWTFIHSGTSQNNE